MRILTLFVAMTLSYAYGADDTVKSDYSPQVGDVIFQSLSLKSDLVVAIEGITRSKYSHCGIVVKQKGIWYVNEASGHVQNTPLFQWLRQSRDMKAYVYRFKKKYAENIPKLIKALKKYQGLPYDVKYRLNDNKIYCSELIYRAYKDATGNELGKLIALGDMNWKPYRKTIEKYEGAAPPLKRLMITPAALSMAKELYKVATIELKTTTKKK